MSDAKRKKHVARIILQHAQELRFNAVKNAIRENPLRPKRTYADAFGVGDATVDRAFQALKKEGFDAVAIGQQKVAAYFKSHPTATATQCAAALETTPRMVGYVWNEDKNKMTDAEFYAARVIRPEWYVLSIDWKTCSGIQLPPAEWSRYVAIYRRKRENPETVEL